MSALGRAGAAETPPIEESPEVLYDAAPCGLLSTTMDGVIVSVNQTFAAWMATSREALIGTTFRQLLSPASQLFFETRYLPVLRLANEIHQVALILVRPDGSELSVLVNSIVATDASGAPIFIRTAVFDSTSRQDYERQLLSAQRAAELSESRVRIIQEASAAFDATTTVGALAEAFVAVARHAFAAPDVALLLLDQSGGFERAGGSQPVSITESPDPRPERDACDSSQIVVLKNIDEALARYPSTGHAMAAARVDALWAVPLIAEGIVVGVLVCYFGRERAIDDSGALLMGTLAWQAMLVLSRIRLHDELHHLALHDPLTGLANRRLLEECLAPTLAAAHRHGGPVTVIFLDLDGFKAINDSLGHSRGDVILRVVADRLVAAVRQDDVVGRLGGDEFLIVCADSDQAEGSAVAERLRVAVRTPDDRLPAEQTLTVSIGVAVYRPRAGHPISGADLIATADSAMYESKKAGKDRITVLQA
ncbi:diguanylate cyclase [Lacisediminihabitans sp. H27-G8]|uniref:sensor domain-containing diguanylate cyclase n=1 Tax=Lacisediminihabitans sp. H27-G8 TaxID=3111909 RepID=UPI0038FC950B